MLRRCADSFAWAVAVFFLFSAGAGHIRAETTSSLTIDASQQYGFAEHLFQNGQYRRAAEEYQRFVFFFPEDARQRKARFQTAESFRLAGDLAAALKHYQALIRISPEITTGYQLDALAVESYFMMAECYLQLGAVNQALVQLHNLAALSDDVATRDRAYYRMGWISMEHGDLDGARRAWNLISDQSRLPREKLTAALEKVPQIPYKSPAVAGTLSVIPGLGQLYLGRGRDALVAFVFSGGTLWASYEAFDNDLPVLGVMLAMVGAGFYAGNFYSAISGAHRYNRNQIRQFTDQLQQELGPGPNRSQSYGNGSGTACLNLQIKMQF